VSPEPRIFEDLASMRIPDNDPAGISRGLQLPAETRIREVSVAVDISHPWIGDLRVSLKPPGDSPIVLYEGRGERGENLTRTWHSQDVPALQPLRGQDAGGNWQLNVIDQLQRDEGKLNRWSIEIIG